MSNAVSTAVTAVRDFAGSIKAPAMQQQIRASLPKGVSLDRFTTTTVTAINHSPELLNADRQSLYNAIVKCAADGLLPDGNDAVLTTFNTNVGTREKPHWIKKVQYQRMVGGLLKQFVKANINAYAVSVYANDSFEFWNDNDGQHVIHRPIVLGNRGALVGVFACGKTPSAMVYVEAMNIEDIDKVRASSASSDGPAWKLWYDRMGQKSALHRLRKRIAIADEEAAAALGRIDDEFDQETGEIHSPESEPVSTQAASQPQQATQDKPPQENASQDKPATQRRPKALQNVVDSGGEQGSGPGPDDVV